MTDKNSADLEQMDDYHSIGTTPGDMLMALRARLKLLVLAPLLAGTLTFGISSLIAPTFTARTTFMPPQQAQSSAATALAALGPLAGLAGAAAGGPSDRYIALMQSATVSDRIVDKFNLMDAYEAKFRVDARNALAGSVRIALGKKDGLITVEVDDTDPRRAAEIANSFVDELRRFSTTFALTEAQQRRAFFERHLQESRDRLSRAQQALQASGFNPGALKAEPRAAADAYARLKADVTSAEVRLGLLRSTLADGTPEVRQQQATLAALREQLGRLEKATDNANGPDYVGNYREFRYQETLFDLYARQFEVARADESREGALIQVVDTATPPERKSKPKRLLAASVATITTALALTALILLRRAMSRSPVLGKPGTAN
jgi:uncharacterized protein involved in exopolysaccharide biosynthesis